MNYERMKEIILVKRKQQRKINNKLSKKKKEGEMVEKKNRVNAILQ